VEFKRDQIKNEIQHSDSEVWYDKSECGIFTHSRIGKSEICDFVKRNSGNVDLLKSGYVNVMKNEIGICDQLIVES
jgi:hypothetical protein